MRLIVRVKRGQKNRPEELGTMVMSGKKGTGDAFVQKLANLITTYDEVHLKALRNIDNQEVSD
jgi:hypothetical protein